MPKYKVLVISLLLKNNEMASFGDEVDEGKLTRPSADLVKEGFVSAVDEKVSAEETKSNSSSEEETIDSETNGEKQPTAIDPLKAVQNNIKKR